MSQFLEFGSVNIRTWSVSELTAYIRELFEIDYRLQDLRVSGELSNVARARSGHLYFTIKDDAAQLKCVMWRSAAERLAYRPGDGDAVLAQGRISVYEAGGSYQLYVDWLEPVGRGDLAQAFEQLRAQLAAEGLFDAEHKKPVPLFPRKIGIVTSADAAALRDILNVLQRRWPAVSVLIAPTLVQGKEAPAQIARALQWLDGRNDIDTIILARGGGSIEDLWAFNEEVVARAIFAAQHPIITGIGHEVDFTIADFVADLRAPTPSAAAELAVPDRAEVASMVAGMGSALSSEIQVVLRNKGAQLDGLARSLIHLSPQTALDNSRQRIDMLAARLDQVIGRTLERALLRLAVAEAGLSAVSPLATLSRGYAIVRSEDGQIVRIVDDVNRGESLHIQVTDGEFAVTVD